MEDFIEVSKMIGITDILDIFNIAYGAFVPGYDVIVHQKENLQDFWKPTLNILNGFCYSFESQKYLGIKLLGQLLRMHLTFNVS